MLIPLLLVLSFQTVDRSLVYLVEEVSYRLPGALEESYERHIWIGRNHVRIDHEQDGLSMIYDLSLHRVIVLDHGDKTFLYTLSGRDKKHARPPLMGLAGLRDGSLYRVGPILEPTGNHRQISGWRCFEFRVLYPDAYGIDTRIWASAMNNRFDKNMFRKLWYAAVGTAPPIDVRQIIGQVIRELNGVPLRIESVVNQDGLDIVMTSTITTIEKREGENPAVFSIPENYEMVLEDN